jgi:hypothetical protein
LLTKLLTPNVPSKIESNPARALIEEISSTNDNQIEQENNEEDNDDDDDDDDDEIEWFLEQKCNESQNANELTSKVKYGFANGKSNVFSKLSVRNVLLIEFFFNSLKNCC